MNERDIEDTITYTLAAKYVHPIIDQAGAIPILLPPLAGKAPLDQWMSFLDGLVLTGSYSDIHPTRYGEDIKNPKSHFDENRDETTIRLIHAAIAAKIPVLGICRGFQEINVALGGSLLQSIHVTPSYMDHREVKGGDDDLSYALRHNVKAAPDGQLINIVGKSEWKVNSLHDQGIDRLADGLKPEAYADDGLIEAFSLKNSDQFMLATQWHIEWQPEKDPNSTAIIKAFGRACAEYKSKTK